MYVHTYTCIIDGIANANGGILFVAHYVDEHMLMYCIHMSHDLLIFIIYGEYLIYCVCHMISSLLHLELYLYMNVVHTSNKNIHFEMILDVVIGEKRKETRFLI